jgi:hypothetical protein
MYSLPYSMVLVLAHARHPRLRIIISRLSLVNSERPLEGPLHLTDPATRILYL